jgi:hypothetical protein
MKVTRYFESHDDPNDTMFVEINNRYRFTGRGKNWENFREHLSQVIRDTISDELADEFEKETADWTAGS